METIMMTIVLLVLGALNLGIVVGHLVTGTFEPVHWLNVLAVVMTFGVAYWRTSQEM